MNFARGGPTDIGTLSDFLSLADVNTPPPRGSATSITSRVCVSRSGPGVATRPASPAGRRAAGSTTSPHSDPLRQFNVYYYTSIRSVLTLTARAVLEDFCEFDDMGKSRKRDGNGDATASKKIGPLLRNRAHIDLYRSAPQMRQYISKFVLL